ncbi:hypothetical protein HD554DRAFT_2146168 [Boletus coccyginus]|nr:hypothetical protein HD554DRAFT_2146168 [Boletus coccyginus]
MTSTKPSTLFVPIFAHATTAQVYSASNRPTLNPEQMVSTMHTSRCTNVKPSTPKATYKVLWNVLSSLRMSYMRISGPTSL